MDVAGLFGSHTTDEKEEEDEDFEDGVIEHSDL